MCSAGTCIAATIFPPGSSKASTISCKHGFCAAITSLGRMTAKGSFAIGRQAHHTACPVQAVDAAGHRQFRHCPYWYAVKFPKEHACRVCTVHFQDGGRDQSIPQTPFATRRHEDEISDTSRTSVINRILNKWAVDQGYDLF